jgi:hypothetical protein
MIKKLTRALVVIVCLCIGTLQGWGQVSLTNASPSATENFNSMGTTQPLPSNWKVFAKSASPTWTGGATSVTTNTANTFSTTTPAIYAFRSNASSPWDVAVGVMTSGSFASPNNYMVQLSNDGTTNITGLSITYNGERYRVNTSAASIRCFIRSMVQHGLLYPRVISLLQVFQQILVLI